MILVTAPTIGKLLGRPRMWAYRQIRAGRFGPIVHRRGLWAYVDLRRVQAVEHQTFTHEQLRLAGVEAQWLAIEAAAKEVA